MGKYNSSLTSVQPIFNALYRTDPTGQSWTSQLIQLTSKSKKAKIPVTTQLVQPPIFELSADPPKTFLKWLINNPVQLSSPSLSYWEKCSHETREKRKAIFAGDKATLHEAVYAIDACKQLPAKIWWRLEGVTQVDCALLAKNTVIFIEGKRTELGASKNIVWYPHRNQVLRNLDCAAEYARQHGFQNFYVMLIVEKRQTEADPVRQEEIRQITVPEIIEKSLPHLSRERRKQLMTHYLGVKTWEDIVAEFQLGTDVLIDRI